MDNFKALGLKNIIADALTRCKYKQPFEVQKKIIPLTMQGKNIVFTSRTGSGKTIAFSVGFLSKINKKMGIQLLIVVPTRELCIQIGKELKKICDLLGLNVGMLYGGREIKGDHRTTVKKNHILVGTPGRLIQHINKKNIKVGETRFLVFDESDQMFDNGFSADCAYIKKRCSADIQIVLSSATISPKVQSFMDGEIKKFELLKIGTDVPETIKQEKIFVKIKDKDALLLKVIPRKKIMIFVNRKARAYRISELLNENGFKSGFLHGDITQDERFNTLNLFKDNSIKVLVVTDVAARGLHINNVDWVINYDVPPRLEYYVHRIGRTGRKDKKGYALTFVCPEDDDKFANIEFEYELDVKEKKL